MTMTINAAPRVRSMPLGRSLLVSMVMIAAAVTAFWMQPDHPVNLSPPSQNLQALLPESLDEWKSAPSVQLITADREDDLSRQIYSQVANRAYEDKDGNIVMLLFAYGQKQLDGLQLHMPEVCYPAQGFTVSKPTLQTMVWRPDMPPIIVKRMVAKREWRTEYVSYWMRIGNYMATGTMDRHVVSLRYGLEGAIPDGLLVRVSSISTDPARAFAIQEEFMRKYLQSLTMQGHVFLMGSLATHTAAGV
jgi:EpsI family protein